MFFFSVLYPQRNFQQEALSHFRPNATSRLADLQVGGVAAAGLQLDPGDVLLPGLGGRRVRCGGGNAQNHTQVKRGADPGGADVEHHLPPRILAESV